jgi:hypothetical protein
MFLVLPVALVVAMTFAAGAAVGAAVARRDAPPFLALVACSVGEIAIVTLATVVIVHQLTPSPPIGFPVSPSRL